MDCKGVSKLQTKDSLSVITARDFPYNFLLPHFVYCGIKKIEFPILAFVDSGFWENTTDELSLKGKNTFGEWGSYEYSDAQIIVRSVFQKTVLFDWEVKSSSPHN